MELPEKSLGGKEEMMSPEELEYQTEQTRSFINADSVELVLVGMSTESDGRGGSKRIWNPTTGSRTVQKFRLIPRSTRNDKVDQAVASDGRIFNVEFVLLGMPDSVMVQFDRFIYFESLFELAGVHFRPYGYQKKSDVIKVE